MTIRRLWCLALVLVPGSLPAQADTAALDPGLLQRPEVSRYLDYFTGPAKDRMSAWLSRGSRYRGAIERRLAEEGLPTEFAFLPAIESGFSSRATSKAGAAGMWQFIPETARTLGLRVDRWVDERRNPARATDAAVRHLRDLTDTFGSPLLAAAAYNSGAGRVSRGLGRLGLSAGSLGSGDRDPFFALAGNGLLARETRDYVPQFLAAAAIGRDPARFGLAVDTLPPPALDSVRVDRPIRLTAAETASGLGRASLADLNPELIRGITPPGGAWLKVPSGLGDQVAAAIGALPSAALPADPPPGLGTLIRVRRGDTVEGLAAEYGVSSAVLRRVNALPRWYQLRAGMALRLPEGARSISAAAP